MLNFELRINDTHIGFYDKAGSPIIEYGQIDTTNIQYLYIATQQLPGSWNIQHSSCVKGKLHYVYE